MMRDGKTSAGRYAFRQRPRVRFGNRPFDVRDAPAAQTREVMVGPGVGVEAGSWPGQLTEQPRVDEQPEVPVDGAQAHPWRSADDQSVDFLGSGVRLDAPDHLEHRLPRSGEPEPPIPQCDLGTLDARWAGIVRCPSSSLLRDDSHFHQPCPVASRYEGSPSVSRSAATRIMAQCSVRALAPARGGLSGGAPRAPPAGQAVRVRSASFPAFSLWTRWNLVRSRHGVWRRTSSRRVTADLADVQGDAPEVAVQARPVLARASRSAGARHEPEATGLVRALAPHVAAVTDVARREEPHAG